MVLVLMEWRSALRIVEEGLPCCLGKFVCNP
jgi:hypothetical protein